MTSTIRLQPIELPLPHLPHIRLLVFAIVEVFEVLVPKPEDAMSRITHRGREDGANDDEEDDKSWCKLSHFDGEIYVREFLGVLRRSEFADL